MPRLSFVCVVHREQGHLVRLAESILDQEEVDVELVAIDDASPDHAPALLDELAQRDPRVRVRHLNGRVGLGEGRNLALDLVAGDYVWFVESTDLLPAGSIAAVAQRLEEAHPDVLLVHHSRADAIGKRSPGPRRGLLASVAEQGAVTTDQRPELADLARDAHNKVFRTEFVRDLGVRFGSGAHSELTVTWPALLRAGRITATPMESYVRREPPNAVRDRWVTGRPEDVFGQYEAVFSFIDEHPTVLRGRGPVLAAMLRHELSIMERLPEAERRAFFHRVSESYRRHRRDERPAGAGAARVRERLVERDAYRGFRIFEYLRGMRTRIRGAPGRARRRLGRLRRSAVRARRGGELDRYYRDRLRDPVDPNLAVFAAYWYRGYACNPRAIYEKLGELAPAVHGVWVVRQAASDTMPAGVDYVVAGTREYYDLIARARYFVNNVNFPDHLVKREGTTHVMTHHGTPLKQMGLDLLDTPGGGSRVGFAGLLRRCRRWDFSISQNAFTTVAWERAFPTRYESLEVGYPRNDVLATAGEEDLRRIRAELGIQPGRQAVLYAPTHREYQPEYVPMLDLAALADGLGPDYVVMARLHYLYDTNPHLRELHRSGRVRDVADHPSVEELCLAADALVTDYSSIMFDYAVLDRPIVIHAPDWDEYRARRGTYFDVTAEAPGVVTTTEQELVEAFRSGAVRDEDARRARASFRARFCSLDDGRAAERVVRRIWLGEREATPQPAPVVAR
jgi:CDP-glycerol glycerophosphotransferase